jgi:hypothetical protein
LSFTVSAQIGQVVKEEMQLLQNILSQSVLCSKGSKTISKHIGHMSSSLGCEKGTKDDKKIGLIDVIISVEIFKP